MTVDVHASGVPIVVEVHAGGVPMIGGSLLV